MIPIMRRSLSEELTKRLDSKTESLVKLPGDQQFKEARSSWKNSSGSRASLTLELNTMAPGRQCCMYCSDGQGTSIDHYQPIASDPLKTWVWANHILACGICNSHHKRDKFDLDSQGVPLFLDPTRDDPFDHLSLAPSTGLYVGTTERGKYTAEALLNRDLLARGRKAAWNDAIEHLEAYSVAFDRGDSAGMLSRQFRLTQRPNLDAFYVILRYARLTRATLVMQKHHQTLVMRHEQVFRSWIGLTSW